MANSFNQYTGNGATTTYAIGFPYLRPEHLIVTVGGVQKTNGTHYNVTTGNVVFTGGNTPANAAAILIYRQTSRNNDVVDWNNGGRQPAENLDDALNQSLYIDQEIEDGSLTRAFSDLSAKNKKIVNLATPTLSTDAATKGYVDTGLATKANTSHTHVIADVTGLQAALDAASTIGNGDMLRSTYDPDLDGKVVSAVNADAVPWTGITGKPSTFAPSAHTHVIADVTGLQAALDGKAALVHVHAGADITSGTVAAARLGSGTANSTTFLHGDSTWAALVAGDIPNHSAALLTSGTVAAARLGSGTANSTTFLHGDNTWAALLAADIPNLDAAKITTGTMAAARLGSGSASATTALFGDQTYKSVVTSVAITVPAELAAAGTPITTAGTLALTWNAQAINLVFAGPGSGSSAAPTFRALVANDIPSLDAAKISTGTLATARLGSGTANSGTFLHGDSTWAALVAADIPNHDVSKLTSGTLGVARGGTSFAAFTAKGSLLVANTTSTLVEVLVGSNAQVLTADSTVTGGVKWATPTTGTVTSVALTLPSVFSVAGSPITGAGTLAATFATGQTQNQVLASPDGSSGAVALRALVAADIPNLDASKITAGTMATARLGSGGTANTVLHGNQVFSAVDINADTTGLLSLTRLATQANLTVVGNVAGSTVSPVALTATQLTTIPNAFVGDAGSGGTKGLVPAPATGDATKYLKGDGTWSTVSAGLSGTFATDQILIGNSANSTIKASTDLVWDGTNKVVTIGSGADGTLTGGAKLKLKTTSNGDIELTPNGTGKTNVTAGILVLPSGSQGTPSLQPGGNTNFGIYLSGEPSIVITAGGGNMLTIANGNTRSGNDIRPTSDAGNDLGVSGAIWKDVRARSYIQKVNTITATTTLDSSYSTVLCNSGSALTVNLPAAASHTGRVFYIKNINSGIVTIDGNASETIDGATTYSLTLQYQGVLIVSDGTNWFITSKI